MPTIQAGFSRGASSHFPRGCRAAQVQTFSLGTDFTTMSYSQSTGEPPDTMGAAGAEYIVTFNNDGFSVFGKDGTLISSTSPSSI